MPQKVLPQTDEQRLEALKTLLDNNELYMARTRFIDMSVVNSAQAVNNRLAAAVSRHDMCLDAINRHNLVLGKARERAMMYATHFMTVLLMAMERGEVRHQTLALYGFPDAKTVLQSMQIADDVYRLTPKIIEGEKLRIAKGGRPVYNPTIGMVATHFDIFRDAYEQHDILQAKEVRAATELEAARAAADTVIADVWAQVEKHFAPLPAEEMVEKCAKYGLVYERQ